MNPSGCHPGLDFAPIDSYPMILPAGGYFFLHTKLPDVYAGQNFTNTYEATFGFEG